MKSLVEDGKLVMLGVTQEQHPDRCRLFAQWHEFSWPILHDPINLLATTGVPIVLAIDEHGVVRSTRPTAEWVKGTFLSTSYPSPTEAASKLDRAIPDLDQLEEVARSHDTADAWRQLGDAAVLWGGEAQLDNAIDAYSTASRLAPEDGMTEFRLGVAYRGRYESSRRQPDDFQDAVDHWTKALSLDPNQYIWRRRIQQYGPRLIKPYPFYDWVEQARREITQRGQTPIQLTVAPSGAEVAQPSRDFVASLEAVDSPDPNGKITRDKARLVRIDAVSVPGTINPGESIRVHLDFRPAEMADWNNEVEPLRIWVEQPPEWKLERRLLESTPLPRAAESHEARRLEFEVQTTKSAVSTTALRGYALYYVCEKSQGTCLYRRQDFEIPIRFIEDARDDRMRRRLG